MADIRLFIDEPDWVRKREQLVAAVRAGLPDLDDYLAHALDSENRAIFCTALDALLILDRADELRGIIRHELSRTDAAPPRVAECLSVIPAATTETDRSLADLPLEYLGHPDPGVAFAALEATRMLVQAKQVDAEVPVAFGAAHYGALDKASRIEFLTILLFSTTDISHLAPLLRAEATAADWEVAQTAHQCLILRFGEAMPSSE